MAFRYCPFCSAHWLSTPPMGARFTCTSKTLRKMLIRCRGPSGVPIVTVSVTSPSPGETIRPSPPGIARSGSRKNHKKKAASSSGATPHAQPPVAQASSCSHHQQAHP